MTMKKLFLVLGLVTVLLASCCNNNQKGAKCNKAEQKCEQKCDKPCDKPCDKAQACEKKCDKPCDKAQACEAQKAACEHQHQHGAAN